MPGPRLQVLHNYKRKKEEENSSSPELRSMPIISLVRAAPNVEDCDQAQEEESGVIEMFHSPSLLVHQQHGDRLV